jgi:hypothetical protein
MSPPTNNVNKTWALLQTTGVKDEQVTCWWDDVRFVIEQHALLKQMSAGRHVAPHYSDSKTASTCYYSFLNVES